MEILYAIKIHKPQILGLNIFLSVAECDTTTLTSQGEASNTNQSGGEGVGEPSLLFESSFAFVCPLFHVLALLKSPSAYFQSHAQSTLSEA